MNTVEFFSRVYDGKIAIPEKYQDEFVSDVKVVLYKVHPQELKAFGGLAHRANPKLWEQEEGAMERAMVTNYEQNENYRH